MVVNFGIIGCGVAGGFHMDAISKIPGAKLAAVCDNNEKRAQSIAKTHGAKAYTSPAELLKDPDVNAVSVCSPSGMHHEHALAAIKAGKHVIIEKPVALRVEDADELICEAAKMGVKASTISQLCFSHGVRQLKNAVDEGLLGKLVSVSLHMKYHRSPEYYQSSDWRGTKAYDGGGALMNQGIHGVDILRHICGPVKSISAHARTLIRDIEVEDTFAALLELENGALGTIDATVAAWPGSPRRFEVSGDMGSAVLEEDRLISFETKIEPENIIKEQEKGSYMGCSIPENIGTEWHFLQLSDFTEAILNDTEVYIDLVQGRDTLEIVKNAYLSSELGKTIYFK